MSNLHLTRERICYRENDFAYLWKHNGIIYNVIKPGIQLEVETAKRLVADRLVLSQGRIMPLYIDIRELKGFDEDGRSYLAMEGMTGVSAAAFYIDHMVTNFLFHILITLHDLAVPTRSFTSAPPALEWLEYYKNIYQ